MKTLPPTIIEAARGVRGRYQEVERIPDDKVPVGTSWLYKKHQEWEAAGFDRVRIKIWSPSSSRYLIF